MDGRKPEAQNFLNLSMHHNIQHDNTQSKCAANRAWSGKNCCYGNSQLKVWLQMLY